MVIMQNKLLNSKKILLLILSFLFCLVFNPSLVHAATVTTGDITSLTSWGVIFNGTLNPKNVPTTGSFFYVASDTKPPICEDGFPPFTWKKTPPVALGAGNSDVTFKANPNDALLPNTNYYYCAKAISFTPLPMPKSGEIKSFKTPPAPVEGPAFFTHCAFEGEQCSLPEGTNYDVAFGTSTGFVYKNNLSGGSMFSCTDNFFATNSSPGINKACFYRPSGPTLFTYCAKEGWKCGVPASSIVAYGFGDSFVLKGTNNILTCDAETFGEDPAPGKEKACYYALKGPIGYEICGTKGGKCSFKDPLSSPIQRNVAYGSGSSFVYTQKAGSFDCNNQAFGLLNDKTERACFIKTEIQTGQNQATAGAITAIDEDDGPNFFPSSLNTIHNVMTGIPAKDVTDTSATVYGSANPKGKQTWGYFRYSTATIPPVFCNQIYGSDMLSTFEYSLGSGNSNRTFPGNLNNLIPNTTYYYCAVASEKDLIEYGAVGSFTTMSDLEWGNSVASITTKNALVQNDTSAYLNGSYTSAVPSTTWFEYRKKKSYQDLINSVVNQATASISSEISLLSPFNLVQNIQQNIQTNPNVNSFSQLNGNNSNLTGITGIGSMPTISNIAQISEKPTNPYQWTKVNIQSKTAGSNGSLSYNLTKLSKNTTYEFRAAIETKITGNNPQTTYGDILSFRTSSSSSVTDGDVEHENTQTKTTNLSLGDTATPPDDAVVHYHEGIEHVLVRQLMRDYNRELIEKLGYQDSMNLETFAWDIADFLARTFGYVSASGKEIRVGPPDRAAYRLVMVDGKLTIYEYFDSKIVAIQDVTSSLRKSFEYEYYYTKK